MHADLGDTTLVDLNKFVFQSHLSIWRTMCSHTHACLQAPSEASQKQNTESTGITV